MIEPNDALQQLFEAHGITAIREADGVTFPPGPLWASAAVVQEIPQPGGLVTTQLDVSLALAPGVALVESFAGLGADRDKALANALESFATGTLHVLLAAFFLSATPDEQVSVEEWAVGGANRRVITGPASIRGNMPGAGAGDWFRHFQQAVQAQYMGPEVHWVRLYYGQTESSPLACEVLLDNTVWDDVQAQMAGFAWPQSAAFYSVRVFLIIAATAPDPQTPEGAVTLLAQTVAAQLEISDDQMLKELTRAGVSPEAAGRALNFVQLAWGRVFLEGLGLHFAPDYLCFDRNGTLSETGEVTRERYFVAATRLAPRYLSTTAFQRLAFTSAEVNAVNNALNGGASPDGMKDWRMSPPIIFTGEPTAAAWERAQQTAQTRAAAPQVAQPQATPPAPVSQPKTDRPWWKRWGG